MHDKETFRGFLDRLRDAGELIDLRQPIDIRHIATLVDQSDKALYFHNVIGYDVPVVSGIIRSQKRAIMSLGCTAYPEIEAKLKAAIDRPIPSNAVNTSPTQDVIMEGDDVDLYKLPIPMSSIYDGGPMITAGVVIARDPEYGLNAGIYRFIVKEKNLTGIDIVTPNNMRLFAQRAYEAGRPCPISISIGTRSRRIRTAAEASVPRPTSRCRRVSRSGGAMKIIKVSSGNRRWMAKAPLTSISKKTMHPSCSHFSIGRTGVP